MENLNKGAIGLLNPIFTIIGFIIVGIFLSKTQKGTDGDRLLLWIIIIGLIVSVIQFFRLILKVKMDEDEKIPEKILEGQRKLVRELFKEDFENEEDF